MDELTDAQALAYIASYADLRSAFGADPEAGRQHYVAFGRAEGRTITFDPLAYTAANRDLLAAFGTDAGASARHYIMFGAGEGRSTQFDAFAYLAVNRDLIDVLGPSPAAAIEHFILYGAVEGRPVSGFDALSYTAANPDLIRAFGLNPAAAVEHYVRYGLMEGRPVSFDALSYIASNPDLLQAFRTDTAAAIRHYISFGAGEHRPIQFDALGYIAVNPDLIAAFGADTAAATNHFILYGSDEGRPIRGFDALTYLASNADLIAAFGGDTSAATRHFIEYGVAENRPLNFNSLLYLLSQPDLRAAGLDATGAARHYVEYGYHEGRSSGAAVFQADQSDNSLTFGALKSGTLERPGDEDYYRVELAAGEAVELSVTVDPDSGAAPVIAVYDAAGRRVEAGKVEIVYDGSRQLSVGGTYNANGIAAISFTPSKPGEYYIVVYSSGDYVGDYDVSADVLRPRIAGDDTANLLQGTDANDLLQGFSGDDRLDGLQGDDVLQGGSGDDELFGFTGNNLLEGGPGNDVLVGGTGDDVLYGNSAGNRGTDNGADSLSDTSGGNDRLYGQDGNDVLTVWRTYSDIGSTVLMDGGSGDDVILFESSKGIDTVTIVGGAGNDRISVGSAAVAMIDAGDGDDSVTINMNTGSQTIVLGPGADQLSLDSRSTGYSREGGARLMDYQPGTDTLDLVPYLQNTLFNWNESLSPFATGHVRLVQTGADAVLQIDVTASGSNFFPLLTFVNTRADALTVRDLGFSSDGTNASVTLVGTAGEDALRGTFGNDTLYGLAGDDSLNGLAGDDVLDGGDGSDRLSGGSGDDQLSGGSGGDVLYGGLGNDVVYGNNALNEGPDGDDTLVDDEGGNDKLYGQGGNDWIRVSRDGTGSDVILIDGGAGNDILSFGSSTFNTTVTVIGGDGDDDISVRSVLAATIDAGAGNDRVTVRVNNGTQSITLGAGADLLILENGDNGQSADVPSTEVTDFTIGSDRLDLREIVRFQLSDLAPETNPFADGYLSVVQVGGDAVLRIDLDGFGSTYAPTTLLTFRGVDAAAFTARELGYAPDGSKSGAILTGTEGKDEIAGTGGDDRVFGLAGDDRLTGWAGNDILEGGGGSDVLNGEYGSDVLYGHSATGAGTADEADQLFDYLGGDDQLFGQAGDDHLIVTRMNPEAPSDTLLLDGGDGADAIVFRSYGDRDAVKHSVTALGGDGKDSIFIDRAASVVIDAGAGDDYVQVDVNSAQQRITLGAGSDRLSLSAVDTAGQTTNTIVTDFTIGQDVMELQNLLYSVQGYSRSNPFSDGYLRLVQSGADTLLELDRDGGGDTFTTLLTFQNTTASSFTAAELGNEPNENGSTRAALESVEVLGAIYSSEVLESSDGRDAYAAQFDGPGWSPLGELVAL